MQRRGIIQWLAVSALAVAALAGPAAARAATIENRGHAIVFSADPGELNHVRVTGAGGGIDVVDVVPLTAGTGCAYPDPARSVVHCGGPVGNVWFELGDGDDFIQLDDLAAVPGAVRPWVTGGPGDDTLIGSDEPDGLSGDAGDDTIDGRGGYWSETSMHGDGLSGGAGDDTIRGGPANDDIYGGLGSDTLNGGTGYDFIYGEEGGDAIDSRDPVARADEEPSADDVRCGPASDVHQADEYDTSAGCERVERPSGVSTTPPAGALGPWDEVGPLLPAGETYVDGWPVFTLTPGGEAVAAWLRTTGADPPVQLRWRAKPPGQPLGPAMTAAPDRSFDEVYTPASDAAGNVVLLARGGAGSLWALTRPPGGEFGDPVRLGDTANGAELVTNGNGDIAAVWRENGSFTAAVRPSGGTFGTPFAVTEVVGNGGQWRSALTDAGELIVAWWGADLMAATRAPDGTQSTPQAVATPKGDVFGLELASDGAGDTAVAWTESTPVEGPGPYYYTPSKIVIARRRAGQPFGAATTIPGAEKNADSPRVAMSGTGLLTVAYNGAGMGRVFSAKPGEPLERVRTFALAMTGPPWLVSNRAGLAALFWPADPSPHAVSTFREGDGFFSRVEDLRLDCDHYDPATNPALRVAINEAGQVAVMVFDQSVPYLSMLADRSRVGRQNCSENTAIYSTDPEAPGAGTERTPLTPPPDPPAPARFRVGGLQVNGSGTERTVHAAIRCPGACRTKVIARFRDASGKEIGTATQSVTAKSSQVNVTVKVRLASLSRSPNRRKLVTVSATRRDPQGRKHTASAQLRVRR